MQQTEHAGSIATAERVGPNTGDEEFFLRRLNLDYPGLEEVRGAVRGGDFGLAKALFAAYVRKSLRPELLFRIPYEIPENSYTFPGESEAEAAERICENHMVSCGTPYAFGERIDWFANPTYNRYKEWTWQLSRHNEWKLLAHAYRETGDERYAACVARQFTSWVRQAVAPGDVPGNETLCWRTIECGIRMGGNWPYILHAFYKSPHFTDDVLLDWYKSVSEHGDRLRNHYWRANWLIMEMNGLAQIGILCPELTHADEWRAYALSRLSDELDLQIYADGFQYELSTGYHDVTVNNYQRLIEVANAYHAELPPAFLPKLASATAVNPKLVMPDGRLPDLNDGRWSRVAEVLEPKLRLFPDREDFRWFVSGGKEGHAPAFTSVALANSGFMVMREGWSPDSSWALLDAAPFGRGHQHEDKLSLLLFANGGRVLTEGGNYAYDDSEMRKYVLSTRSHNTIRVDGMDQNRCDSYDWRDGDIKKPSGMRYSIGDTYEFAEGVYDEGYGPDANKSVTHKRALYFVKRPPDSLRPFFIAVDRLYAASEHRYELLWHLADDEVRLTADSALSGRCAVFSSHGDPGYNLIRGQQLPEWQGWASTGGGQGEYRAVSTLRQWVRAADCRVVTVFLPLGGECPLAGIEASLDVEATAVTLVLRGGKRFALDEAAMR